MLIYQKAAVKFHLIPGAFLGSQQIKVPFLDFITVSDSEFCGLILFRNRNKIPFLHFSSVKKIYCNILSKYSSFLNRTGKLLKNTVDEENMTFNQFKASIIE